MALNGQKQWHLPEQQLHKFGINESTEKWVNTFCGADSWNAEIVIKSRSIGLAIYGN